jgi:hypothetical protein
MKQNDWRKRMLLSSTVKVALFVIGYLLLTWVILPRLGVPT